MVRVWVVNKSEKDLKFYLNGGHFYDDIGHRVTESQTPKGTQYTGG